jgi:FAD:protein FMN transferase
MNASVRARSAAPEPVRAAHRRLLRLEARGVRCGAYLLAAVCLTLMLGACREQTPAYTVRIPAFGTLVDVNIVGVTPHQGSRASKDLRRDFAFMQTAWSADRPGPLQRVNALCGREEPFAAPPSVLPLIRASQTYAARSGDLFNPAAGKLLALWGFDQASPPSHPPPPRSRIERLVAADPQMKDIHIDGIELRCDNAAVSLDFRDFALGYGIDRAVGRLRELGVRDAMVSADGNLRVIGNRAGRPWRVAVRRPTGGRVFATIDMSGDESLFTVTEHDRTFVYGGRTFHDRIDPRTGYPAEGTGSATVIATKAAAAAAAASALFIAGPKDWQATAKQMGVRYALLVDSAGRIHMSPEMADRVQMLDQGMPVEVAKPLARAPRTGR